MIAKSHLLLLLLLLGSFTCDSPQPAALLAQAHIADLPTRDELMNAFRESRKILLVYGSQNPAMVNIYADLAKKMNVRSRFASLEIKPCAEVTPEDWQTKAIVLIGTSHSNAILHKIVNDLPFKFNNQAITFDNQAYHDPSTVALLSFYPNPLYAKLPITIITALQDEPIQTFLENKMEEGWRLFGWSAWNYEIYKNNKRQVLGMFNPENWSLDRKVHFDFSASEMPVAETNHFRFFTRQKTAQVADIQTYAKQVESSAERIHQFIDPAKSLPVIHYNLYTSAEEKGLIINNTNVSNVDFIKNEVHTVWNDLYKDRNLGKENQLLLRTLLGKPKITALEQGLATYFVNNWQRKGYDYWALRIFNSGNIIPLTALLNNDNIEKECNLLTTCLSASLVEFLLQKQGKITFLNNYIKWSPSELEIRQLEREWYAWLSQKSKNFKADNWAKKDLPYLKGFNFAHEGYGIFNGYISNMATQSLDKQANSLHCNATAIVPYTFMENPNKPSFLPIANSPGDENDEGVIHSAYQAQKLGMTVVLKPQIWVGRGSWPGDINMSNEADWQQFIYYYEKWILHYALLAEMYGINALCIGTEFSKATLAREQDWRNLIHKIRKLYHGKLTYAANWGEEFEKVGFWNELDFIGLNSYYPLSTNSLATKEELKNGFLKVLEKAEKVQKRYNKPLVFTEIGFKSVQTPWLMPHEASNGAPYFGAHQKLCYEVIFENIHNKPWIQGIMWWKFPSYIEHRGIENDDFTPNRKPAEAVVKEWFAKMP
ncbi:MAG: glycoside hydrolase family 113 [Saprospiraceae bacterium]